jgi:Ribonuclease D
MLLIYHVYNNSVYHCLLQAAHAVLQLQELGKPVYKVKNVSLNALCEMYDAPVNPMKDQLKNVYRRDQRYWARRPLTRDMMLYAAADVLALVPQVYNAMTRSVACFVAQIVERTNNSSSGSCKFVSHCNIHRRSKKHLVLNP